MDIRRKYILLVRICEVMSERGIILSKISLHQFVYIFQELYSNVNYYDFKLFTYGPYSVELTSDLDYLFSNNILNVEYCRGPSYFGSKIELGEEYKLVVNGGRELLNDEDKIIEVIELFGSNNARSLELRGTIIYLYINAGIKTIEVVVERIQNIKPYFREEEIKNAIKELKVLLK